MKKKIDSQFLRASIVDVKHLRAKKKKKTQNFVHNSCRSMCRRSIEIKKKLIEFKVSIELYTCV